MNKFYRNLFILMGLLLIVFSGYSPIKANEPVRPAVRALWVDAFHDGFKTPAQVDQLIADALKANINTLIVQVRRRGDAYYNHSIEPRTEDPSLPPGFDALQYLIDKAHANQLEVHAWLNTLVAWNNTIPPRSPDHVWNQHGPQAKGEANWVSYYRTYDKTLAKWSDQLYSSYYLDPGNPDVVDYTVNVYLNVVKNYDVDGIHLDYSRYAEMSYGYNPTSVARFNAQYGTTGLPDPDNPQWAQWRRDQTANLVRKIYLKAIAIKPNIKVSSAVITWGGGPVAGSDWEKSRAYWDAGQEWRSWLAEGIIDMVMPMNYFREWRPTEQLWYNQWIEWEKDHQYGRQIVIGPGIFWQYIEQSLDQIRRAQTPSALGNYATGESLFAYGGAHLYSTNDFKDWEIKEFPRQPYVFLPETNNWFFRLLVEEGEYLDPVLKTSITTHPVFPIRAAIPDMPWKSHPVNGYLTGTVSDLNGQVDDHVRVTVYGPIVAGTGELTLQRAAYTDGSGWFGLAELSPGQYRVTIDKEEFAGKRIHVVTVQAGQVAEVSFK